jgi:hypothetical protein
MIYCILDKHANRSIIDGVETMIYYILGKHANRNPNPNPNTNSNPNPNPNCYICMGNEVKVISYARWLLQYLTYVSILNIGFRLHCILGNWYLWLLLVILH